MTRELISRNRSDSGTGLLNTPRLNKRSNAQVTVAVVMKIAIR